ncbi:TlpA family protein disulfide reductase [Rhizosphaericola mali]|uniref:TlpA family protein disulfide reductase n=1 Tax=Rhizosphaericola mali TaxID=2545455 RepID=A0A5P2G179_9BACT|nr:TlpA disulfide reductase family protein [Rhizosphaericola mali]QES87590.1 TlpA family protein disulfide reductase [Rhizosphaericola mali]
MNTKNIRTIMFVFFSSIVLQLRSVQCYSQSSLDSISQQCINIALAKKGIDLPIGETLPTISVSIEGAQSDQSILQKFSRGKILILDFWSQWCGSCIASFPHLEKLQEKYANQILILPVTFQSRSSVCNFRKTRMALNRPMLLPTIVEDTLLRALFPHNGDPFEVWIDPNGKLRGTTSQFELTESVIEKVLNGDWSTVEPLQANIDGKFSGTNKLTEPLFGSFLGRYDPHFPNGRNVPIVENGQKILRCTNAPISWLFQWALRGKYDSPYFNNKRCLYKFKDSITFKKFFINMDSIDHYDYVIHNKYCYELRTPIEFSDKVLFDIAYRQLEDYFKISVRKETHFINCLKLVRISNVDKIAGDTITPIEFMHEPDEDLYDYIKCSGTSMSDLITALNAIKTIPLVIDSTNYLKKINVNFRIRKMAGLDSLQLKLKEYGLKLIASRQLLDVLVYKDKE